MENYSKLRIIGSGSFGTVWLIRSKFNQRNYVLKEISLSVVSEKERTCVLNEVQVLSKLRHKNIVRYKEAFLNNNLLCITMEYAHEGDLSSKIEKQAGAMFPRELIFDWFIQLCLALKYIHNLNILHRDIKCQNIFLTKENVIKLGDFGIACVLQNTLDHAQTIIGTPFYLSPEMCQSQPYNHKSDIWALGCVLYELITLKHPFECSDFPSLVIKILNGEYEEIPKVHGPLLCDIVRALLNTVPVERPSAKQILHIPAMKKYVDKVLTRGRIQRSDSVSSTAVRSEQKCSDKKDWRKLDVVSTPREQDGVIIGSQYSGEGYSENLEKNKMVARKPVDLTIDNDIPIGGRISATQTAVSVEDSVVSVLSSRPRQNSINSDVAHSRLRCYSTSQVREGDRYSNVSASKKRLQDTYITTPKEKKLYKETYTILKKEPQSEVKRVQKVEELKPEDQEDCTQKHDMNDIMKVMLTPSRLVDVSSNDTISFYMRKLKNHLIGLLGCEKFHHIHRYLGSIVDQSQRNDGDRIIENLYEVIDDVNYIPLLVQLVQLEHMFS